jgi:DNA repair protein RadC
LVAVGTVATFCGFLTLRDQEARIIMTPYRVQEIKLSFVRSKRPTFHANSSTPVAYAFRDLAKEVRESLFAVYLTAANEVIGIERVSTGSIGCTHAEPAEVLRTALIVGAQSIIIIHNHPSGSTIPSDDDHAITEAIAQTAKLFRIRLLDHIIIGANGTYYSFSDNLMLERDGDLVPVKAEVYTQRPRLGQKKVEQKTFLVSRSIAAKNGRRVDAGKRKEKRA